MAFFNSHLSQHIRSFLKHQKHTSYLLTSPKTHFIYANTYNFLTFPSFFEKTIPDSVPIEPKLVDSVQIVENGDKKPKNKKPLVIMFKEAAGLCERNDQSVSEDEDDNDLKQTLRKLEKEVRNSKLKSTSNSNVKQKKETKRDNDSSKDVRPRSKSLYAVFTNKDCGSVDTNSESSRKEPLFMKKISPDMVVFLRYLYEKGYFNDANFLSKKAFDVSWFEDIYGREYIKFTAEKFGKGNQEIAKWLSGSDLKLLAQFGCPSLEKRSVFAAKRLRIFFKIQEDKVCGKCVLKPSCKFVNQSIWKGDTKNLHLIDVMKVITMYALDATPRQLVVSDEVKACVSRVLKEVVNLSQTTSRCSALSE